MLLKLAMKSVSVSQWYEKVRAGEPQWSDLAKRRTEYPILDGVCEFITKNYETLGPNGQSAARGWLQMTDWLTQIAEEQPKYDVFVSYAHADAALAHEIRQAVEKAGGRCFMAEKDISVSMEWEREIQNALLACSYFLVLLTPNSKDSAWVLLESGGAWILGKRVIPATAYVDPKVLPDPIRKFQARPVQSQAQIAQLVQEMLLVAPTKPPKPKARPAKRVKRRS